MFVKNLTSHEQYLAIKSSKVPSLLFFWAEWHELSRQDSQLREIFNTLAQKYQSVQFYLVEAEQVPDVSENLGVTLVPTFFAINGSDILGKVEGVNPAELNKLAKKLSEVKVNLTPESSSSLASSTSSGSKVLHPDLQSRIEAIINSSPVMLFMKGVPGTPRCGFSRQIVEILQKNDIPFASFDILTDEDVRQGLKVVSDWPTYPQLFVAGTLVGGLDILKEMDASGNLKEELGVTGLLTSSLPPPPSTSSSTSTSLNDRLYALTHQAPVMVFVKGTPETPRCGFSRSILSLLSEENISFSYFDILTDDDIRQGLKTYSDWPTFPQLYVNGMLVGGLDIVKEMQATGDLKEQLGLSS